MAVITAILSLYSRVMVEDENEASPVFDRTSYSGLVQENASPGQSVLSVSLCTNSVTIIYNALHIYTGQCN